MPGRADIFQRIVQQVAVTIKGPGVGEVRHDLVGADELPDLEGLADRNVSLSTVHLAGAEISVG